jgi:hypothetical protein
MRNVLGIFIALLLSAAGALLLDHGVSDSGRSQSEITVAGATLLSFGLCIAWLVLSDWRRWREPSRRYRRAHSRNSAHRVHH